MATFLLRKLIKKMSEFIFATYNQKKVEEIYPLFEKMGHQIHSLISLEPNASQIEESGKTFYSNALLKCQSCFSKYHKPCIADDSGLVVPLLNGEPGIMSSRYAGDDSGDKDNLNKLLSKINLLPNLKLVPAYFECVIIILINAEKVLMGRGKCHGFLLGKPRGEKGFGYDPIFVPTTNNPSQLTFAEMSMGEKNKISHRYTALNEVIKKLADLKL